MACCVWVLQLLSGCLHCDCHLSTARLFDRFDPDREKWSSYLMRAEFYFDSNNITTEQKKGLLYVQPRHQKHLRFFRIYWSGKWQMFHMKKWKRHLNSISRKNAIFSLRVSISPARFSSKVNLLLISWLNCAIKPKSVSLKSNAV